MRCVHVSLLSVWMCSLGSDSVSARRISNFPHILVGCATPVPLLPLPACRRCKAVWCGQTLRGGTADPGWRRLQAVNLCGNETMCTHTATVCTPSAHNSAYLCREQSAQCLLVAQLDTAVEPSCSSSPRTGQDRTELCGRARGYCCCCCTASVPRSSHSMIGPAHITIRHWHVF